MGKSRRSRSRASTSPRFFRCCNIHFAGFSEKRPSRVLPTITEMTVMFLFLAVRRKNKGQLIRGTDRLAAQAALTVLRTAFRARSERVHLVAGWSDVGYTIRQLRLRHRQRIEGFAQQLDSASLCHEVPGEQVMGRSPGRSGAPAPHILGEGLVRRLDQDAGIIRRKREVRIDFEQLVNKRANLAAAGVARFD